MPLLLPALGPGAVCIIGVPIPGLRQREALRGLQAERIDVAGEHQEPCELLPTLDDAELGAGLDRVDGIAAGIGEPDHLRLRRLRL